MSNTKSKKISFRVSEELFTALKLEAEEEKLTLSKRIIKILENRPQKEKEKTPDNTKWSTVLISISLVLFFYIFIKARRALV